MRMDALQDMAPKSEDLEKFLAPCIALFEYDDDNQDLLPIKPIGIQVRRTKKKIAMVDFTFFFRET